MPQWKIATFNVNSIRARLPIVLDWLHANSPDVLCLQETKVQDKDFPVEEIREAGYQAVYQGERSYNGVAIISQAQPKNVVNGLGKKQFDGEARLITAEIDGVTVINAYVPQGRDADSEHFQHKLEWFDAFDEMLRKKYSPKDKLIWTGDLNIALEDKDVHDPKRLKGHVDFHPEVQNRILRTMEWGLEDVFRKHRPDPGEYSFWDYRVKGAIDKGLGWRIDHILATAPMAAKSADAWVDAGTRKLQKPSDHAPVVAVFKL